jgi:DNA repair exonuclease SbcCD nuclease subunit
MSLKPYGLMADLHCHDWSAFSALDSEGRNSRLVQILNEVERCAMETIAAGGDTVIIAGDVFHTRGTVSPTVFNPVRVRLSGLASKHGIYWQGIPGNHDLKSDDSRQLASAVAMLGKVGIGFSHNTFTYPTITPSDRIPLALIPWHPTAAAYLAEIEATAKALGSDVGKYDLICHIGIDGTLTGVPDRGVSAEKLAEYGFNRVFSGHYHHHRDFGNGVYSIGATTHQTWSDIGTKAGFMIVYEDHVKWFASHAPSFIDLTGEEDEADLPLIVDGHFVRARMGALTPIQKNEARELLLGMGAQGVLIDATVDTSAVAKRAGVSAKSIDNLEASVGTYITEKGYGSEVAALCASILVDVQT